MKTLKITLALAVLLTVFASCTKQDLSEDDVLITPKSESIYFTGGAVKE
jgi:hypothetical protein